MGNCRICDKKSLVSHDIFKVSFRGKLSKKKMFYLNHLPIEYPPSMIIF